MTESRKRRLDFQKPEVTPPSYCCDSPPAPDSMQYSRQFEPRLIHHSNSHCVTVPVWLVGVCVHVVHHPCVNSSVCLVSMGSLCHLFRVQLGLRCVKSLGDQPVSGSVVTPSQRDFINKPVGSSDVLFCSSTNILTLLPSCFFVFYCCDVTVPRMPAAFLIDNQTLPLVPGCSRHPAG